MVVRLTSRGGSAGDGHDRDVAPLRLVLDRQDSDLLYLTGLDQQDTILVLMSGNPAKREILFVSDADPKRERADEARLRRARRLELLRTARLQLSALGASGPGSEPSASDRLRALCAEMEQLGAAVAGTATCHGIADPLEDETAVQPGAQVPRVR